MENIVWNVAKLREYFDSCQKTYNSFLAMSDSLIKAFQAFVDDDTHTGTEAESSKAFVTERQIPLIIDITDAIQQLEDLQEALMTAFSTDVDSSDKAKLGDEYLKKVTLDFGGYEDSLKTTGDAIASLADTLNASCSEVGSYTKPSYTSFYTSMEAIASNDGLSGIAPESKKKLDDFDTTHSTDISLSAYQTLYETIVANIEAFINGIGDGRYYDITSFNETKNSLKWVNPLDVLQGAELEEYKQYVENMHAYLKGKKERCEVYKYDPVNMCNGNYINEHTDIELGGRYTLEFKRFYNAISSDMGSLGMGWTHSFEVRLYEDVITGRIKI
uniref:DUF6531 domain-containing protein n=1 Tax=Pseudobutyrivibrio ruminis TaxID=46206 RepID=UPI00048176C9